MTYSLWPRLWRISYVILLCGITFTFFKFKIYPVWALIASFPRYPKHNPVCIETAFRTKNNSITKTDIKRLFFRDIFYCFVYISMQHTADGSFFIKRQLSARLESKSGYWGKPLTVSGSCGLSYATYDILYAKYLKNIILSQFFGYSKAFLQAWSIPIASLQTYIRYFISA